MTIFDMERTDDHPGNQRPHIDSDARPPADYPSPIIVLGGAIRAWWDDGWETDAHWAYVEWRKVVTQALIDAGYLVYRPHEAFKGTWNERAQAVNNAAIAAADLFLDISPLDVPSEGTEREIVFAIGVGTPVIKSPPEDGLGALLTRVWHRLGCGVLTHRHASAKVSA